MLSYRDNDDDDKEFYREEWKRNLIEFVVGDTPPILKLSYGCKLKFDYSSSLFSISYKK